MSSIAVNSDLSSRYAAVSGRIRASQRVQLFREREIRLRALMLRGLDGDVQCLTTLLRSIRPVLAAFFGSRVDGCEAEDLVQEVLISVHERRTSYDRGRPFTPWLFGIAHFKLIDHFRRLRRHEPIERIWGTFRDDEFQEAADARIDVATLLGTLPDKQAESIRNRWIFGMSVAEAANRAGIGKSDVKVSTHRGMRALNMRIAASYAGMRPARSRPLPCSKHESSTAGIVR